MSFRRTSIEKERKKVENLIFKTNVLGSEVARYVVQRQLTSYLIPNTASAPIVWSADRLTKERYEHNGNTIKYLKSPSVERKTPAIFRFYKKMQLSLTERSDL